MPIRTAPANSSYAVPLVDEIPSDTRTFGLCGVSTKTSNQTFKYRCPLLELATETLSAAQTDDAPPTERAATNPYVAFDQMHHNLILIVPPHDVLDET